MASLGELVARMSLDIGQFTGALNKVEQQTAKTMDEIKKQFSSVKGELLGFAAGVLSVHTAMEQFNKAVERGEALKEFSAAFGVTVEAADKLSLAMQLAGTDMGTLEKQMKSLSAQIVEASNPASKAAGIFKDMGVQIKDASGQMLPMEKIYENAIRQLKAIEDPALRSAAAVALFGKGSTAALKATEELDDSLLKAQKQLDTYGVTSAEVAAASKEFKDQMLLTGDMVTRLFMPVVKAILPVFEDFRKALGENTKGAVSFAEVLGNALATGFRIIGSAGILLVGMLKEVGMTIGGVAAAAVQLLTGHWKEASHVVTDLNADIAANREVTKKSLEAMWGYGAAVESTHEPVKLAAVNAKSLQDRLNGVSDAAKKAAEALEKEMLKGRQEIVKIDDAVREMAAEFDDLEAGSGAKPLTKEFAMLNRELDEVPDSAEMVGKALQLIIDKTGEGARYMKEYRAQLNAADDDLSKFRDELVASWKTLEDGNEDLQNEIKLIGLVGTERELEMSLMKRRHDLAIIEKADREQGADDSVHAANVQATNDLYDRRDALIRAKGAATEYNNEMIAGASLVKSAWSTTIDTIYNKGVKGFRDLWEQFKQWAFRAFLEVAGHKVLVSLIGSAAGPASAQENMLGSLLGGGGGGGGMLGNISTLAGGTGALSSAGLFSSLGGAGTAQAGFLAAQTAEFGMAGTGATLSALGATGAGSIMTTLAPLMAAAPYIAAAAAVAYVVYDMVVQKKGGPKEGGFASTEPGVARYYTPNSADSGISKIVMAQTKGYDDIVKALGGTGHATFALGYDTDPQGTANSRVSAGAFVNGKQVYGSGAVDAGRDDKSLQAAINLEGKRALLGALQNSELPSQIARLLNSLSAGSASEEQIDSMLQTASTAKAMIDVLAAMADPMAAATEAFDTANQTALESWDKQRDALYDLANTAPQTAEGLAAVTAGTQAFYVSTVQLLIGIKNAKQQMDNMFGATRDTIEKAALSPDQLYAREQQKAKDLFAKLQTATDPAEIARLSEGINASINSAFSMLTPEQQKAKSAEFLAGLDKVQALADERMKKSMDAIVEQTKTDREFLTGKLNDIVTGISDAGNNFKKGSDNLVNNGVHVGVDISVHDDRLATEVNGGGARYEGGGG
jgi:hypothetical protein